jgi:hypothetical protein
MISILLDSYKQIRTHRYKFIPIHTNQTPIHNIAGSLTLFRSPGEDGFPTASELAIGIAMAADAAARPTPKQAKTSTPRSAGFRAGTIAAVAPNPAPSLPGGRFRMPATFRLLCRPPVF